ncbi:MAG: Alpha-maltose-phosphate synthase [Bacteroidota bacterium]|jgi:glycogen synthase
MKIAIFTNEFPPNIYGGAGVHVDFLSLQLSKLAKVEVRCFGDQHYQDHNLNVLGIDSALNQPDQQDNNHLKMFHNLSRNVEMSQHLLSADVVHCHTWYTHLAGIFTKQLLQIPLILTTHSLEAHRPWKFEQLGNGYFLSKYIEQQAYSAADGVIAVSQQMKNDVVEAYSIDPEKVSVIHNGIDPEFYKPTFNNDFLASYEIDFKIPIVLFVGRITRQKGISQLIGAAKHFDKNCQIVLCAGAPDTPEIAAETSRLVAELQESRKGVFLISEMLPREKIKILYSHATVFVCPSLYEPFGIINLEALSCETAVVASHVGGIPEIISEAETGFLIPLECVSRTDFNPKNPDEFQTNIAYKVNFLLQNPQIAKEMGQKGREIVLQKFSWTSIAKTTLAFYQNRIDNFKKQTI